MFLRVSQMIVIFRTGLLISKKRRRTLLILIVCCLLLFKLLLLPSILSHGLTKTHYHHRTNRLFLNQIMCVYFVSCCFLNAAFILESVSCIQQTSSTALHLGTAWCQALSCRCVKRWLFLFFTFLFFFEFSERLTAFFSFFSLFCLFVSEWSVLCPKTTFASVVRVLQ